MRKHVYAYDVDEQSLGFGKREKKEGKGNLYIGPI